MPKEKQIPKEQNQKLEPVPEEVQTEESPKSEEKSTKQEKPKKPSQKDYEKKVLELSKKGLTSEKIGSELVKQGIHPKDYEKRISEILGKDYTDPELKNLEEKLERIEKHSNKNKQDKRALRERSRVFSERKKRREYLKIQN